MIFKEITVTECSVDSLLQYFVGVKSDFILPEMECVDNILSQAWESSC